MENANSPEYLEKIKNQVIENLKRTAFAPSVAMTDVPRDPLGIDEDDEAALDDQDEDENKDVRYTERQHDKRITNDAELSESEDEDMNERNGVRRQPGRPRRRNIMDYQNPHAAPDSGMDSGMATPEPLAGAATATAAAEESAGMDFEAITTAIDDANGEGKDNAAAVNKDDTQMKMEEDEEEEQQRGEVNTTNKDDPEADDVDEKDKDMDIKMDNNQQSSAASNGKKKDDCDMDVDEDRPVVSENDDNDKTAEDKDEDTVEKKIASDKNEDNKGAGSILEEGRASSTERPTQVTTGMTANSVTEAGVGAAQVTPPESPPATSAPVASGEMAGMTGNNAPNSSGAATEVSKSTKEVAGVGDDETIEKGEKEVKEKDEGDKDVEMAEADEQSVADAETKAKTETGIKSGAGTGNQTDTDANGAASDVNVKKEDAGEVEGESMKKKEEKEEKEEKGAADA